MRLRVLGAITWLICCVTFAEPAPELSLTEAERQWLAQHPVVTFTGDPNWLPFEAFTEDGQYIGIVAEFLREFEHRIGIRFKKIPSRTWSHAVEMAVRGEVDVLSDDRQNQSVMGTHRFTESYKEHPLVVVSREGGSTLIENLNSINGATIGYIRDYGYIWALRQTYPEVTLTAVDDIQDGLRKLDRGDLDYFVATYTLSSFHMEKMGLEHLHVRGQLPVTMKLALGVRKDWPELLSILNKTIASMSSVERHSVAESWFIKNAGYLRNDRWVWQLMGPLLVMLAAVLGGLAVTRLQKRQLQKNQNRFRNALAAINAGEWNLQTQSLQLHISAPFMRSLGFSGERVPRSLADFLELVHPDDRPALERRLATGTDPAHPETSFIDEQFRLRTGEDYQWLRLRADAVPETLHNGGATYAGTLENIDRLVRSEAQLAAQTRALQERENFLQTLVQNIPDMVAVKDLDGHYVFANNAFLHFFGLDEQRLHTQSLSGLVDATTADYVGQQERRVLEQGQTVRHEIQLAPHPGAPMAHFESLRVPLRDASGAIAAVLSISRDYTQLHALMGELQAARAAADQANESKSVFLANMSHEIRTPLNAVLGYSQLLLNNRDIDSESQRQVQLIHAAGERLLALINDILDLSKIEAGKLVLARGPVDLARELKEILGLIQQRAEKKNLILNTDIALGSHTRIVGDAVKLGQVLMNLLGNAVKFTEHGSVSVRVYWEEDSQLHIEISDTGSGITATELEQLFQPFAQGSSGAMHGGTGLGLVLSRRLVEAMGGRLSIDSRPQQGTRVTVVLPCEPEPVLSADMALPTRRKVRLREDSPVKALVVDDDPASREVLSCHLQSIGAQVMAADNGEQALESIQRQRPDIVFTDIRMPRLGGLALLQTLRQRFDAHQLPVVAVTASSLEHERRYYLQQGFQDFIGKPIELYKVNQVLDSLFSLNWHSEWEQTTAAIPGELEALPAPARDTAAAVLAAARAGDVELIQTTISPWQGQGVLDDWHQRIQQSLQQYDLEAVVRLIEQGLGDIHHAAG
ncbi:MAG: hypothetical protein CML06_00025 [Pseudomonadales bacterium]|nr:hypothetical protein [Pseudomonadales bacterium]